MSSDAYDYIPATMAKKIPPLYATEKIDDPTVFCKLFTPDSNWTWYILEHSADTRLSLD